MSTRMRAVDRGRGLALAFLLTALVMGVSLLAATPAQAKTFTVDIASDAPDNAPGDGKCDTTSTIVILCSLRAAIEEANEYPEADAIHFNVLGGGLQTIKPNGELPFVTEQVTIDGYTQPGATENTIAKGATNATPLVELSGENAEPWASGLLINAPNSVVRGLVINRFGSLGIALYATASGARVEGNFIGTDPSGTLDLGNAHMGVSVTNSAGHTIGGASPAARNLISGNGDDPLECGVRTMTNSASVAVTGNLIGTQKNGTGPLGNQGNGVCIDDPDASPGGGIDVTNNTIAFNGNDGVRVLSWVTGNLILSNSIHTNGADGIDLYTDLGDDGATPNDPKDLDTGANNLQNKPILTSATTSGGKTTIEGKLNSTPKRGFRIQFFSNPAGDEGKKFVGEKYVTTDASGNASFSLVVQKAPVPVSHNVTATATGREGTSEFSAPKSLTRR